MIDPLVSQSAFVDLADQHDFLVHRAAGGGFACLAGLGAVDSIFRDRGWSFGEVALSEEGEDDGFEALLLVVEVAFAAFAGGEHRQFGQELTGCFFKLFALLRFL